MGLSPDPDTTLKGHNLTSACTIGSLSPDPDATLKGHNLMSACTIGSPNLRPMSLLPSKTISRFGSLVVRGWFAGSSRESALQFCECVPLLQIAKKIMVHLGFGLGSRLVQRWLTGGSRESAQQLRECMRSLQITTKIVVHLWFGLGSGLLQSWFAGGSRMVRGSFARVCPADVQCVRVLQITNKIMVHLWFGLRSGWFAGGSCESALQFCECMRLSQFARKIVVRWWLLRCSRLVHVVVHAWFVAGSLVRSGSFARGRCFP